jgi:hypothetical protein
MTLMWENNMYSGFMSSSWNDTQETGSGESLTDGQIQQGSDPYRSIGDFYYTPLMTSVKTTCYVGQKLHPIPDMYRRPYLA